MMVRLRKLKRIIEAATYIENRFENLLFLLSPLDIIKQRGDSVVRGKLSDFLVELLDPLRVSR
jgi:hypothetical protein